jgi:hypothetical protein
MQGEWIANKSPIDVADNGALLARQLIIAFSNILVLLKNGLRRLTIKGES